MTQCVGNRSFSLAACLACVFLFLSAAAALAASSDAQPPLTNFEVLERLSNEAAAEIAANLASVPAGSLIAVSKAKGIGEADFLVENALAKVLTDRGFKVLVDKAGPRDSTMARPLYRLSYQIIRMSLSYPLIWRSHGFGSRHVERIAEVDLFTELFDLSSGGTSWVGDTKRNYHDRISYGSLKAVEEEQYEFTRPPRHEIRWSRFVEPVVVSGIIGGLVYLFFANQSNE